MNLVIRISTAGLLLISFFSFAQQNTKNKFYPSENFYSIKNKFYIGYAKNITEKKFEEGSDEAIHKFKRWEYYWENRLDENGNFPVNGILQQEWEKYVSAPIHAKNKSATNANWLFAGPSSISAFAKGGLGRVNCIAFHPTQFSTFWVGTPMGGLWKTSDSGMTWSTITDSLPILGISDVVIDYSNPSVMYIATGDAVTSILTPTGVKTIGVLKSTDGGISWNTTGLNFTLTDQELISRLIIDPVNPMILLATTSNGIWRTSDGGITWSNQQTGWFFDIEFKPFNSLTVYASTLSFTGTSQIFRSINGGITWSMVTSFTGINRIDLAVTPNAPDFVFASCVNTTGLGGLEGLYSSSNSGASYTQNLAGTCSNNMLSKSHNGSLCGGQGIYDLTYTIHPANVNEIWLGGINNWKTTDGGSNWNIMSMGSIDSILNPNGVNYVHSDKHKIAYHPQNSNYLYVCHDGGLSVSTNGGSTWQDISNGLGISQVYRLGTSASAPDEILAGLQDNGLKLFTGNFWTEIVGGDIAECIIDYTNSQVQYATVNTGYLYRTTDHWATRSVIAHNIPGFTAFLNANGIGPGAWLTPVVMDPADHQTLYIGFQNIWKTTDQGNSWSSIFNFNLKAPLQSIAVAPSNNQIIYAATYDTIFGTANGGGSWNYLPITSVTGNASHRISYITVNPINPYMMWITITGFSAGNKIFQTSDGGSTWTNISGTLPNVPVNCSVYEKGSNDAIYIGTDLGVFYRDNTMSNWIPYNYGLPNIQVNELEISYNNKLYAATWGRGIWKSDLYSFSGIPENEKNIAYFELFPNPASETISILLPSHRGKKEVEIFDVRGEEKYTGSFTGDTYTIRINNLPDGLYLIRIKNENAFAARKFIVEQ